MKYILFLILIIGFKTYNFSQCVDPSLIDSSAICFEIYDPVCGCNDVTYSNACYAVNFGGVTSWTPGECSGSEIIFADSCTDLVGINFGECNMIIGYGLINGICSTISGCGTIVGNIDYAPALNSSIEACQANCMEFDLAPPCSDLSKVDLGICQMALGIGILNGQCSMISGCSNISGMVDYSDALYANMEECNNCLLSVFSDDQAEFLVFPNPAVDYLTVKTKNSLGNIKVRVFDILNREVYVGDFLEQEIKINLSDFVKGTYILQLAQNNKTSTKYFIKN